MLINKSGDEATLLQELIDHVRDTTADDMSLAGYGGNPVATANDLEAAGRRFLAISKLARLLEDGTADLDADTFAELRREREHLVWCEDQDSGEQRKASAHRLAVCDQFLARCEQTAVTA